MPYCEMKTTVKVSPEQKKELGKALTKVIEQIPGKTERWIMTGIEDDKYISFAGTDEKDSAVITLKTFGETSDRYYDLVTADFCRVLSEKLGIAQDRIYVIHEPIARWGWNGGNF